MKTWKLCLLALVPGVLGWMLNFLLSQSIRIFNAGLPGALYNLLFWGAYLLPAVATIVFCLWLGRRCSRERVSFPKFLLCTQWFSVVSLGLYTWQNFFVSDESRSIFLTGLAQALAAPLILFSSRVVVLLDTDRVFDRPEFWAINALSLVLLALLYIAGYWWGRRRQQERIRGSDVEQCSR